MSGSEALAATGNDASPEPDCWPDWYRDWRATNRARFEAWGLPTRRQENWKYTDLKGLGEALGEPAAADAIQAEDLADLDLPASDLRMTFVDGRFRPDLSVLDDLPDGLAMVPLSSAQAATLAPFRAVLEERFAGRDETTAALAAGNARTGCVLTVGAGASIDRPVQLLHLWTEAGGEGLAQLHHLVQVGRQGGLRVRELHVSLGAARLSCNLLTTAVLDDGAQLDALRVQALGSGVSLVTRADIEQARDASYTHSEFDLGGRLVRHDVNCRLVAAGAAASLQGIYALSGSGHVDNHSRVDHLASDTRSDEHYKGVLDGAARGVFNGKVIVAAGTARIDASQVNRNLLLSREAEIDTKPELEIYADDVKCAHGATVGQLDERQLFYLRSRGIAEEQARLMLIDAFCREIVDRVPDEGLREWIGERLVAALPRQGSGD